MNPISRFIGNVIALAIVLGLVWLAITVGAVLIPWVITPLLVICGLWMLFRKLVAIAHRQNTKESSGPPASP